MFKWCYIRAKLKESDAAWKFRDAVSASAEVYYGRNIKKEIRTIERVIFMVRGPNLIRMICL